MLGACIDIGSNTTRLLVAEIEAGRLREVAQQRAFTRLGAKGGITPEKIELCAEAVATQVRVANELGCATIRAVATAAIRTAPNREELVQAIEAAAGIPLDVLSGEEEAEYAFMGATHTLSHLPVGEVGVVDVGGGSTELVCGTLADGVSWSVSFRVGSGFLADHYLHGDPPALDELENIRRHVQGVFEGLQAPKPRVVYAVGGSATSLRKLVGAGIDHETLQRSIRLLAEHPADEIARRFELDPVRVKLLPAGMLLLDAASAVFGAPLQIAKGGLREGVLLAQRDRERV